MNNIFEFITQEENAFALPITVADGYEWSLKEHVNTTILYKNSRFTTGRDDNKPFKNITRPILNLQYRAEGFDVKDIELFINHSKKYWKSFLVRKYHEKWAKEQGLDEFIDELVETYVDFGGVLIKKVKGSRPEVVKWQTLAFCDQTNVMGGPLGIKHFFSPDQLRDKEEVGWGDESNGADISIEALITLAEEGKEFDKQKGTQTDTPGKYIEIYEIHGVLPQKFLNDGSDMKYVRQMQIVGFYKDKNGDKQGRTLFKVKQTKSPFKFLPRDGIYGRALGFGGGEELFEPQVWTNYSMIRKKDMLDAASKTLFKALNGNQIAERHPSGLKNLENMEIIDLQQNEDIEQLNTFPRNYQVFEASVEEWEENAEQMGSAGSGISGEQPPAGTPFKLQELVASEAHSLHEYRKGKLAAFMDEIYRDWIIENLKKEIVKEQEFLMTLSMDEMETLASDISRNLLEKFKKEKILNGEDLTLEELEEERERILKEFQNGDKKFIKILEKELKGVPLDVHTNIASKQKDVAGMVDKLTNVIRFMLTTYDPKTQTFAVFNDPRMVKLFNQIMESSGLSPIEFGFTRPVPQRQTQENVSQGDTQPLKELAN